jgi:hypothetical protein
MKQPLGVDAGPGLAFSMDHIVMNVHGNADSHIDVVRCCSPQDSTSYADWPSVSVVRP